MVFSSAACSSGFLVLSQVKWHWLFPQCWGCLLNALEMLYSFWIPLYFILFFFSLKQDFNSCHHVTAKGTVYQIIHSKTRLKQLIFFCSLNLPSCSFTLCLVAACSVRSRAAKTRSPCWECYVCGQRSPLCPILENGSSGESHLRSYHFFFFKLRCSWPHQCMFFVSGCSCYGYKE